MVRVAAALLFLAASVSAGAQALAFNAPEALRVPGFWDPAHRQEKPDLSSRGTVRFLTEAQSPPFSFIGADGLPTGFHVDLARAVCAELEIACTIQALRWDLLIDGIEARRGDAIIGGIAIDPATHARFDFSQRYLTRPARFVTRRSADVGTAVPEEMAGRKVAVVRGTAHEAYLRDFFLDADVTPFDDAPAARAALKGGEVDALFDDGLNLSLWLNGAASERCCVFRGGPYTESRYFGEGLAIAVAPGDDRLRRAFDYALGRVQQNGVYEEIYLRYFPVSFY